MKSIQPDPQQPLKSRSTLFFERYARAENENMQMRKIVYLLSGLLIVVLLAFVYSVSRPRAMYYIPGAVVSGLAYPDQVPQASVRSFATAWLMGWMNYTPDSVEGVYARSLKFLSPGLLAEVHARAAEELEKIRRDRLSSVFVLTAEPRMEEDKGIYKVILDGKRGIYMGKEEMSVEGERYVLSLLKAMPTDDNPYALNIYDIRKEEVANVSE
ncbi:MAG: hypothetical protein HQL20_07700 [Candidatus Omnitrophica bacterium]|nr:hypothetical protein [Candidatus Omnitrophota bacterium]